MPDFGIMRGFGDKLFGNKLVAGQLPTNLGKIGSQSFGFDADAAAFFARVTAAGGTLSATEQLAIDTLVKQMKLDGIWSSMKAIYPMVGASAAACAQNLKSSSFTGTFTSGWTFASTGVIPNGSAYMNTGFNPTLNTSQNSLSFSFYSRTNNTTSAWDIGAFDGSIDTAILIYYNALHYYANNAGTSYVTTPVVNTLGHFINTRTTNNIMKLVKNGVVISTSNNNVTGNINLNLYIGAENRNNTGFGYSNRECSFAHIGDGLTDTQASALYTAVQNMNTMLSRQI
jgi:hypothetical protein